MTLRNEITAVVDHYTNYFGPRSHIVQALMKVIHADNKARYGWTEEDCPFKYGEEIEVGHLTTDYRRHVFITFDRDTKFYLATDGQSIRWFSYARAIPKEEPKTANLDTGIYLVGATFAVNGKKYKLVEVAE